MKVVYNLVWEADPFQDLKGKLRDVDFVQTANEAETLEELATADALVLSGRCYTAALARAIRKGAPRLRWIQTAAVGTDTLRRHGVRPGLLVTNAAGLKGPTVAEHAMSLLLALCHCIPDMERNRQAGRWGDSEIRRRMASLEDKTLVLCGYGSIGQEIARRAKAFDMHVIAVNRTGLGGPPADRVVPFSVLDDLLPRADVVVLALPLTAETNGLFDAQRLNLLKPGAYFVNVGRGDVVSETALLEALEAERIAGAGLDVFEREPLPVESPLWRQTNVIISPHVATIAGQTFKRFAALFEQNIGRLRSGKKLLNAVDDIQNDAAEPA